MKQADKYTLRVANQTLGLLAAPAAALAAAKPAVKFLFSVLLSSPLPPLLRLPLLRRLPPRPLLLFSSSACGDDAVARPRLTHK